MRVLTDFPGGGAADIRIDGGRISFDAPAHNCPQPMWFCLRVVEAAGQPLELVVRNAGRCLGGDTMAATRPVVGVDGEWSRVPDEQVWYDHEAHQLHFRLTPASDQVTVAYCYPYQLADLQRRLAELAAHPHLERLLLGRSPAGRPLEAVRVTDPSANGRKRLVWCVARQHAGEVPGSFVFEGLLEAWLAATPEAARLRREAVLCALPMVDVDAVETGSYGKDQSPVDFNRDWTAAPHHPAIARLLETIAGDAAQHDYRLFLDLHAPHPSGVSFLVPARGLLADPGGWDEHWRLGALLEAASAPPVRLADYPPHSLDWELRLADSVATEANRRSFGTIATTLEIAYHRDASGELVGPTSWRAIGAALTGAIARWLAGDRPEPRVGCPVPRLDAWIVPRLPRHVGLTEAAEAVTLEPRESENLAVVETPPQPLTGSPLRLELVTSAASPALKTWVRFYDHRRLRLGEPRDVVLPATLEPPPGAVWYTVTVTARNLTAPLTLRLAEPAGTPGS